MKLQIKMTLDDIKAKASRLKGNADARLVYAVHSPWWNLCPPWLYTIGGKPRGIPCDPRGSVLLETGKFDEFIKSAEDNLSHYGRHGIQAFVAAYHGNVTTDGGLPTSLDDWEAYNALLDEQKE